MRVQAVSRMGGKLAHGPILQSRAAKISSPKSVHTNRIAFMLNYAMSVTSSKPCSVEKPERVNDIRVSKQGNRLTSHSLNGPVHIAMASG